MTLLPSTSRRGSRSIAFSVGMLALGTGFACMVLLDNKATLVSDFSPTAPVMGRWHLVDDAGLRARGLPVPETLLVEPYAPRLGETQPDVPADRLARLSSGECEVLIENGGVWFDYVPGSGVSPFAEVEPTDGVALMLGLHDVLGHLLDRLVVGLGPDGLLGPPGEGTGPRLSYARG